MADGLPLVDATPEAGASGVELTVVIAPLPGTAGVTSLPATGGTVSVELGLLGLAALVVGAVMLRRSRRRRVGARGVGWSVKR